MTTLRMTMDEYGKAIRAAFEAGYIDGCYHPKGERVMVVAACCSDGFWQRVKSGLAERLAAKEPA